MIKNLNANQINFTSMKFGYTNVLDICSILTTQAGKTQSKSEKISKIHLALI